MGSKFFFGIVGIFAAGVEFFILLGITLAFPEGINFLSKFSPPETIIQSLFVVKTILLWIDMVFVLLNLVLSFFLAVYGGEIDDILNLTESFIIEIFCSILFFCCLTFIFANSFYSAVNIPNESVKATFQGFAIFIYSIGFIGFGWLTYTAIYNSLGERYNLLKSLIASKTRE